MGYFRLVFAANIAFAFLAIFAVIKIARTVTLSEFQPDVHMRVVKGPAGLIAVFGFVGVDIVPVENDDGVAVADIFGNNGIVT